VQENKEVAIMCNDGPAGRVAKYTAQSILHSEGYMTGKLTGTPRLFDIIAWKKEKLLGLAVRTSRSKGIAGFPALVSELAALVHNRLFPGDIQVWILQSCEWKRYQILAGGAILQRCRA